MWSGMVLKCGGSEKWRKICQMISREIAYRLFWVPHYLTVSQTDKNDYVKILPDDFSREKGVEVGLVASFWSLKKGTRTLKFRSNETSPDIQGPLGLYDYPWKKNASEIFLLAKKKHKTLLFGRQELETSSAGFSDTLNLTV